jgi:hypothetical protein
VDPYNSKYFPNYTVKNKNKTNTTATQHFWVFNCHFEKAWGYNRGKYNQTQVAGETR